jgi:micrococcal nuclease
MATVIPERNLSVTTLTVGGITHHADARRRLRNFGIRTARVAFVLFVLVFVAGCSSAGGETGSPADRSVTVRRVVDGDTVVVSTGETLRLIGMDTPETVDPRKPVQCFGREASKRAHQLLDGASVRLTYDPTQGRLDKYGRTLAYVWLADGRLYNEVMIADGYAHEYTYAIPYRFQSRFLAAERAARRAERGLWSPTTCAGDTSTPSSTTPVATAGGRPGCDPSYPDVCIPPSPPDLDCADVSFRRFRVVGPDPHRFDMDHNGVGCEA